MASPRPSLLEVRIGQLPDRPTADLNLLAGQFYFGSKVGRVRTLLGSCVGVTLWNPARRVGGMCHFLLPTRSRNNSDPLDARYGDEAMYMLVQAIERVGTRPQDYQAHLYGGADTMPGQSGVKFNVGERNIEKGWSLIDHYGFSLADVDVGDHVPRNVSLHLGTGQVDMRRGESLKKAAA